MLELTRPLICLDVETTGIDVKKDRIIQLGIVKLDPSGESTEWSTYVNPEVQIPAEATAAHHITNEMVSGVPTFAQLAPPLSRRLVNCDFAGYNLKPFDLPIIANSFARANVAWSYDGASIIDAYRLYVQMYPRNLSAYIKQMLGENIEAEAHDALVDARWTLRGLEAFLDQHPQLPRTPKLLHELAFPTNPNAFDKDGRFEWRTDGAIVATFGEHKTKTLQQIPRSYLSWIVSKSDMSAEVKNLCARAMAGDFKNVRS